MSKSKKNVVDPEDIIARLRRRCGALVHAVRQSARARPALVGKRHRGMRRFVQRLWRLFGQCDERGDRRGHATRPQDAPDHRGRWPRISRRWPSTRPWRGSTNCTSAAEKAQPSADRNAAIRVAAADGLADDAAPGRRSAGARWAATGLVAQAAWPEVDEALLVEDEVTIAVQHKGKLRDTLTVPNGASKDDAGGACTGQREGPAFDRWCRSSQGDRGARPAGEYRHMMRAAAFALALAGAFAAACRMRAAADLCRRGEWRDIAQGLAAVEVAPHRGPRGLAGAQCAERPAGRAGASAAPAISARCRAGRRARGAGPADRRYDRPRAPHPARTLPAGRCRQRHDPGRCHRRVRCRHRCGGLRICDHCRRADRAGKSRRAKWPIDRHTADPHSARIAVRYIGKPSR